MQLPKPATNETIVQSHKLEIMQFFFQISFNKYDILMIRVNIFN